MEKHPEDEEMNSGLDGISNFHGPFQNETENADISRVVILCY